MKGEIVSKYLPKLRSTAPDAVLVFDSGPDDEEDPEVLLHYADQRRWSELQSQGLVPCDDFGDE